MSTQDSEFFDKAKKDKKKKQYKNKWDSNTLATGVNVAEIDDKKRKKKKKRDISEITYSNCNKIGHYTNSSPKPWKLKD